MRKKHWTLTPWFIIFAAVMMLMAFASFEYNIVLCYVELGISVAAFAVVFVLSLRFRSYINNTVKSAAEKIKGLNPEHLEKYKYPYFSHKFASINLFSSIYKIYKFIHFCFSFLTILISFLV